MIEHTFAICAYRESPYLEECIVSLERQTTRSRIIVCTSTPNDHIREACKKHGLALLISTEPSDIATDWNFAMEAAGTPYVTLCHQDDLYEPDYWKLVRTALLKHPDALICFSDYGEMRSGERILQNKLLKIKRFLLWPLRVPGASKAKWAKRLSIAFGNAISCPSVTYHYGVLPHPVFEKGMKVSLDWQAWEKLSRLAGGFVYIPRALMFHRIHEESTTSEIIGENRRTPEDYEMFLKFWPQWIAKRLCGLYANSQKSNQV